jgi:hypothetical protein
MDNGFSLYPKDGGEDQLLTSKGLPVESLILVRCPYHFLLYLKKA